MLNPLDFFKTELTGILEQDADTLTLPVGIADSICEAMVEGTVIPLILSFSGAAHEVITIDSATNKVFSISRGQYGTAAARWPVGSCLQSAWTTALLDEYICQIASTC